MRVASADSGRVRRHGARRIGILLAATSLGSYAATVEELVVFGRAEERIGTAQSASEGLVGYDDIQLPPLLRVGELVEAVPGMVATQHSGTGKANQYFLRGFNLDHGTDFSASLDGVPINLRSHGHGQGYLDLNFLIPELVETSLYRKGPYSARTGDFSSAGSVEFSYRDELDEGIVEASLGEDAYRRGLAAGSVDLGTGHVMAALEAIHYDGPWDLDENLDQLKLYLGYSFEVAGGHARVSLHGYDGEWDATDQIPRRAVDAGIIGRLGFVDPDLGGDTERWSLTGVFELDAYRAGVYVVDYSLALYSNFTYYLDVPDAGDEFEQRDDRTVWGAWIQGARSFEASLPTTLRWGGDIRYDDIDEVGLYGTTARVRTSVTRSDSVEELSASLWTEAEVALTDRLRLIGGIRVDAYDWDVAAVEETNSGSGDEHLVSPKLAAAWRFNDSLEGYASWGKGFHSNDVRGATIAVDPGTGDLVDPVEVLVESEGAEIGLRFERGRRFNATLAAFWLELDSELVYVGDAGTTEPNDATERTGVEATAFWRATDWLALYSAYTVTDAEFKRDQGGGREIPGAVEQTFTLGVNGVWANGLSASARLRHLGEAPLVEDDSVRTWDSWLLNAGIAYRHRALAIRLDVFNVLDANDDDISYFYASRLPGEPLAGVEDVHFHPLEPRTVRASVAWHW
jgi:outer membrane cobalamin receptor